MHDMRLGTVWGGLLLAGLLASGAIAQEPAKPKFPQDSPETAFRSFNLAMLAQDEAALKALTLPAEGFEWLLKGQRIPADKIDEIRPSLEKMEIKRLKAGDKVVLPGNREFTIRTEQVGPDRAVLSTFGSPIPTNVQKVDGVWKVDVRPVIAGRKAADAARKKAEAAKKKPKE
jgi:hypothetical protein